MPTYLLEHLATFTVSPENDLVYPADGMRRLLAMEKTSGIWTQKVGLALNFVRSELIIWSWIPIRQRILTRKSTLFLCV